MPEAYLFKSDTDSEARRYAVSYGDPTYEIGRVICPDCGAHSAAPYRYPDVDVSQFEESITRLLISRNPDAPYRKSRQGPAELTVAQMQELSARLAPLLGPERPFGPFTELGPHKAKGEGRFEDFSWANSYGPVFLRRSVFETAKTAGLDLNGFPGEIRYRRERLDPLIELQVLPRTHIHPSRQVRRCATCGCFQCLPRDVPLDPKRFDPAIPLSCVFEQPYLFVANAALADFIRERKLTGAVLTPAEFE